MTPPLKSTIVTVSDEMASGIDLDRAGPLAEELLTTFGVVASRTVVRDDADQLTAAIFSAAESGSRFVLTCGGTGVGPNDQTSDVVARLLSFEIPGITEEIRRRGLEHSAPALVSREIAGVIAPESGPRVFVLCAPGSRGGVRDAIGVVGPMLGYIVEQLDGKGHA